MLTLSRVTQKRFVNSIEKDEFYYGQWWLPNKKDESLSGVLYFNKSGGIRLHVLGAFLIEPEPEQLTSPEIILGTLVPGGTPISLVNCIEYERKNPFVFGESGATQRFEINAVAFSFHFPTKASFAFRSVEFSTTYLIDWLNPSLVKATYTEPINLSKLPDSVLEVQHEDNVVKFVSRCHYTDSPDHSEGFTQRSWISIDAKDDLPFESFVTKFVEPLVSLVQFGTSYLNSITFFNGHISGVEREVKIILTSEFEKIERSKSPVFHYKLFNFKDIGEDVSTIINRWLNLNQQHKHIFDLYFDSLQVNEQFPISKFLILEQAIESFHTEKAMEKGPRDSTSKQTFLTNKKAVLSSIQDIPLQAWLNEKFNYLPELRVRLHELIEDCHDLMRKLTHDVDVFVSRVVKTRNYYTHYNPNLKGKIATAIELEMLTHALRILLNFHLLLDMGFSKEKATEIISSSAYYRSVRQSCTSFKLWNRTTDEDEEDGA